MNQNSQSLYWHTAPLKNFVKAFLTSIYFPLTVMMLGCSTQFSIRVELDRNRFVDFSGLSTFSFFDVFHTFWRFDICITRYHPTIIIYQSFNCVQVVHFFSTKRGQSEQNFRLFSGFLMRKGTLII